MTREEYEHLYAEALHVLQAKIPNVSQPEIAPDGIRIVSVSGMMCDDEFVFRLAWGKEIAVGIVGQRWTPRR